MLIESLLSSFCINECVLQMAKKIKKLEKETAMYRQRWENSNKALVAMAEEVSAGFVYRSMQQCLKPVTLLIYCKVTYDHFNSTRILTEQ